MSTKTARRFHALVLRKQEADLSASLRASAFNGLVLVIIYMMFPHRFGIVAIRIGGNTQPRTVRTICVFVTLPELGAIGVGVFIQTQDRASRIDRANGILMINPAGLVITIIQHVHSSQFIGSMLAIHIEVLIQNIALAIAAGVLIHRSRGVLVNFFRQPFQFVVVESVLYAGGVLNFLFPSTGFLIETKELSIL